VNFLSRFFMVIEGQNDAYPNYHSAKVHLVIEDPSNLFYKNSFICSPIFPLVDKGFQHLPEIKEGTRITFLMVPSILPTFFDLQNLPDTGNKMFFSLGLANLIIIEQDNDDKFSLSVIANLKKKGNLTATESWLIDKNNHISISLNSSSPQHILHHVNAGAEHCGVVLSSKLSLHLKFAVSEYIISVNKLITASKKFSPHYFEKHLKTIQVANELIYDLSFLNLDFSFTPTEALLNSLGVASKEEAIKLLESQTPLAKVEELINDKHGMIIQFNSSLSYIYSQAYSGTFPIFDHIGIVRRHSLLGLGSAIGSLFELLLQLESALVKLPFESIIDTSYGTSLVPDNFLTHILDPSTFNSELWKKDKVRPQVVGVDLNKSSDQALPEDFYNRLSFFSGRLGFREYEFSATAAIQVVVESHTLPWHIINYTHEIIHNHVRILLNQLLLVANSNRNNQTYENWLTYYTNNIRTIFKGSYTASAATNLTYRDYFITVLLKFILNSQHYGSLSYASNKKTVNDMRADPDKKIDYLLPAADKIKDLIKLYYKDVTEIFVHTIDYCYIYNQQAKTYLTSIWTSWSTIPAVINDIKQYIVRSMVIVGLSTSGLVNNRFEQTLLQFKALVAEMKDLRKTVVFDRILDVLSDSEEVMDLRFRFYNCIIVGDLVYNFFIGRLEGHLDNQDLNVFPAGLKDENENPISYYIKTNSFEGQPIRSKVRFLLDQLGREVFKEKVEEGDDLVERTSAWLLLLLSSNEEQ
jgi:hypothetical protein